jgi:outer membrane protein TolC
VVQVLWTFGKIDTLRRMARTGLSVGRTIRAVARLELRYQISRGWWTLVLADELDAIIDKAASHLGKERDRIEALRDEGDDYNPTDLLRLRMLQADFESKSREARRGRETAADALRLAMELPHGTVVRARHDGLERTEWPEQDMGVWERLASANHPRLVARRGGTMVRLAQVRLARNQRWPDLVLTGRVAYTYAPTRAVDEGESLASNPSNPTQSGGGLALRWPINVVRSSARSDSAQVALRRARAEERADVHKIRLEVRRLYRELRDATDMVAIHERAMKAARGWLRAESEMHEGGFTGYDEVLRSIEQYYRRRLTWLNSIYAHNVLVAETSRAVGFDLSAPLPMAATGTQLSGR